MGRKVIIKRAVFISKYIGDRHQKPSLAYFRSSLVHHHLYSIILEFKKDTRFSSTFVDIYNVWGHSSLVAFHITQKLWGSHIPKVLAFNPWHTNLIYDNDTTCTISFTTLIGIPSKRILNTMVFTKKKENKYYGILDTKITDQWTKWLLKSNHIQVQQHIYSRLCMSKINQLHSDLHHRILIRKLIIRITSA